MVGILALRQSGSRGQGDMFNDHFLPSSCDFAIGTNAN